MAVWRFSCLPIIPSSTVVGKKIGKEGRGAGKGIESLLAFS